MADNRTDRYAGVFGGAALAAPSDDEVRDAVCAALQEVDAFAASAPMLAELNERERAAVLRISDDLLLGEPGAAEDAPVTVSPAGAVARLPGADYLIPFAATPEGVQVAEYTAWVRLAEAA